MKTHSLSSAALLVLGILLPGVCLGANDDRQRGNERGNAHGAAPTGSGSFRPAPAPRVEPPRPQPSAPQIRAPRVEQNISRPPAPVIEHYQRPAAVEERRPAGVSSHATALPSLNTPFRAPAAPVAPTNVIRQPVQQRPAAPETRAQQREDFLGMHEEPAANRSIVPNRFYPQTAPGAVNRAGTTPAVAPQRSFDAAARRAILPNPTGRPPRAPRPALSGRWASVSNNYSQQANRWRQLQSPNIAAFQANRGAHWNQIQQRQAGSGWRGQYGTRQYQDWRRNLWDYRRHRGEEIWDDSSSLYENLFNNYWWSTCSWRQPGWNIPDDAPPWWWWIPATWQEESAFFGPDLGQNPVTYDPGDNVFYNGEEYDVDGQNNGTAAAARDQAIALANPQIDEAPIPEPAPDGQPEQWLPLGAWALTQQEQGDPVLYFQLSVNRGGLVAGGYKNALTGDEQPIVGQFDKRSQRLAWHIANAPQTVFETGLSSLDYDVASVFLHFNGNQTQTWLLVRLPSPESPPGSVKTPEQSE